MREILHVCNDFHTNLLYHELLGRLGNLYKQIVIAPIYSNLSSALSHPIVNTKIKTFVRSNSLMKRLFWYRKIHNIVNFAEKNIDLSNVSMMHAHTLFSDGGVAYLLSRRYNIPYVVAIRNTDINVYFKYFFCYRKFGYDILKRASKIIVISPSYINRLMQILPNDIFAEIESKIQFIPNGINDFWLYNRNRDFKFLKNDVKLLYVGSLSHNKNILSVIKAVEQLRNRGLTLSLTIVGRNKKTSSIYQKKLEYEGRNKQYVSIYDKMKKEKLLSIYRGHDIFVMPSFTETFGLVYVEALSQGLPIIYTKDEGFDGIYANGFVGFGVNPYEIEDICRNILIGIENYDKITSNIINLDLSKYSWDEISIEYSSLYNSIIMFANEDIVN